VLPPRIVADRNRSGSFLAVLIAAGGMFGVFLFVTYYLQQTRGYSPLTTGLAFLPLIGAILITSTTSSTKLLPVLGPKPLVTAGMLLAAAGMLVLTGQLGVASSYARHVLPALVLCGLGLGLVMAPAMNTATVGVTPSDAGVASATVNTSQQVGGAIGTALLNTVATTAVSSYLVGMRPSPSVLAQAAVHGYTVAFWWSAGLFLAGALICGLLLREGAPRPGAAIEPVLAA
jgi:predicted MFS family arabinose efflux permease